MALNWEERGKKIKELRGLLDKAREYQVVAVNKIDLRAENERLGALRAETARLEKAIATHQDKYAQAALSARGEVEALRAEYDDAVKTCNERVLHAKVDAFEIIRKVVLFDG